jgi:hypothetical protein
MRGCGCPRTSSTMRSGAATITSVTLEMDLSLDGYARAAGGLPLLVHDGANT